jgi:hypothetical protein
MTPGITADDSEPFTLPDTVFLQHMCEPHHTVHMLGPGELSFFIYYCRICAEQTLRPFQRRPHGQH